MRYGEPRQRSAELLRLALAHMGQHDAAFNPLTFAVWYEHAAGINPALSAALDALAAAGRAIDDAAVLGLYETHVAPADAQAVARVGVQMQRLMHGMAQSASQAGHRAGAFGAQLDELGTALAADDVQRLRPRLDEVRAGTAEMRSAVDALQHKVAQGQDEISRLRADLERARTDALLDPLTGILNRKGFEQRLAALLAQPQRAETPHCLVMLDIDHFKKVNDTHGHLMGDQVLQAVGGILRGAVTDPAHAAARFGGEEFAILLPHSTLERSAGLADEVRLRTKAMKVRKRGTREVLLTVTLSGGVADLRPGDDAAALVARADAALYAAKHGGRDRVARA